ncbi:DEAD/DEAH box helicase [Psychrobacter sanguinis]|uniref:DEAD/DEAH box helicase n=1 Tax=Psychrobacter sanguinis TaxID=861445 RepID=UPI00191AEB82|nr:DEAD/DEAH box helicase [Psychrobacter sanguinis]MCC3308223.1 DEAD/DEAH box helicase [Psychrobacter sanguinis]UEC25495.1 DEAD/DEAH box helicase [Psychrobacter sanguinis]
MDEFITFDDLALSESVLKSVKELGFTRLTPIQAKILPHTLAGQDAIGQAQTGTGKTATFLITIIEALLKRPFAADEMRYLGEPRAVILAPTRELANQIFEDAIGLTQHTDLHSVCIMGGVDYEKQTAALDHAFTDILIATPGRLIDLIHKGHVFLDRVEAFVLDEADRMLDMGFIPDIKRLMRYMPANTDRQSLLFSATFNQDVMNLAYQWLLNPVFVEIEPEHKTSDLVEQHFHLLTESDKFEALNRILMAEDTHKVIVFANRKDQVKRLYNRLSAEHNVVMLSGDVDQSKRERYLDNFKNGDAKVLVATDVAGRGIHVDDISHVVNYTLPDQPDDYVHRIGRTGRAGQQGVSISFVSEDDAFNLPAIEAHLDTKLKLEQLD